MGLLEKIADIMQCTYISDLRGRLSLDHEQLQFLNELRAETYALSEWQEAVRYITGNLDSFNSAAEGKNILLDYYIKKEAFFNFVRLFHKEGEKQI